MNHEDHSGGGLRLICRILISITSSSRPFDDTSFPKELEGTLPVEEEEEEEEEVEESVRLGNETRTVGLALGDPEADRFCC